MTPRATYRLQLTAEFGFAEAAALVGYLDSLGISHLYLSPILEARPSSTHGYDVADPEKVATALGGEDGLRDLATTAQAAGMGLVVDIVPNHIGTGPSTPLWEALLAEGRSGPARETFDVDWDAPLPGLAGKVVVPVLARPYGEALTAGEIALVTEDGQLRVRAGGTTVPLSPSSRDAIARNGAPVSSDQLHALLEQQHYRLVGWREGGRIVNYRRFFAIDDLAAVRVEDPFVFESTHATLLRLVGEGLIEGLRVDHPDGLADPGGYLQRLAERSGGVWTVVEKILAPHESLPAGWPVAGTTGYELGAAVAGLFVDPAGLGTLSAAAVEWGAADPDPAAAAVAAKAEVLEGMLSAELRRLARDLWVAAQADLSVRDLDDRACEEALTWSIAALDVYRTYVDVATGAAAPVDVDRIRQAVTAGAAASHTAPPRLFDFLGRVLLGEVTAPQAAAVRTRFQQLAAAATAKGVEDTLLYRHVALLACNEVGLDLADPCVGPAEFHRRAAALSGAGLRLTASHDSKRGEDARLRLAALSELAGEWVSAVSGWEAGLGMLAEDVAIDRRTAWIGFQTLLGIWPVGAGALDPVRHGRVRDYLVKAAREAGEATNWADPDAAFEEGIARWLDVVLDPGGPVVMELAAIALRAAEIGVVNGLAQVLLRATVPGVPDTYQGTELWDDSLVDPDNRRPVDFAARAALLTELDSGADPSALWGTRHDGRIKLWVLSRALRARRDLAAAFAPDASYRPLEVTGRWADHAVAFARMPADRTAPVVVVVPRLVGAIPAAEGWGDTAVDLPATRWIDLLAGAERDGGEVASLLDPLPVALLAPR